MKKHFIFLLISTVIIINLNTLSYSKNEDEHLNLSAETAILIDANTEEVLYEKESNKTMFPASTTKVLTALIALESAKLDDKVIIDEDIVNNRDGNNINLKVGEVLSMNDLLHALLISSANDAAEAIAKHISGSVENFAILMNQEAKNLGANNSNFKNPSGLPDEEHVSTAYDLAIITKYALKNDVFKEIVKQTTYTIKPTNKTSESRKLRNSNKLLFSDKKINVDGKNTSIKYEGVEGVKTGYTKVANQCMISYLNNTDRQYISVTLHSIGTNIYIDTHKLFNYTAKNSKPTLLVKKNEFIDNFSINGASKPFVTALIAKDFAIKQKGEDLSNIEKEFVVKPNLKIPISKGDTIGKVNFKNDGKIIGSVNMVSGSKINKSNSKFDIMYVLDKWWFWFIISLIILRILIGFRRFIYRVNVLRTRTKAKKLRKKGQT